jgi:phosphonate transport system substrate-binding protein
MKLNRLIGLVLILGLVLPLAVACGPKKAELGTEDNPIIWSFVPSGEMERVAAGAESVADLINKETGLVIKTNVATEYAGVVEAMCSDPPETHMASLATFSYVLAADKGCAEAELVSVRFGSPTYNGQFIVRADSGITSIADLKGKTFCRPDPLSTSGWIIPMITMRAEGINTDTDLAEVVDAGSHDAVAAAVYNGDCDAGATYVDARTRIEADYPDVMDKVVVLAVTENIPNDGVQYVPSFPRELRDKINDALLKIAGTEEGHEALSTAYQWDTLEKHDDTFYDPFRQVLQASGMSVEELQE